MGVKAQIARVLEFTRVVRSDRNDAKGTDIKGDAGGGDTLTGEFFQAAGDDAQPLTTDYMLTVPIPGTGKEAVIGFVDVVNAGVSEPGEKRTYARNQDGEIVSTIHQKSDGSIDINADGPITINGVTFPGAGDIETNGKITADDIRAVTTLVVAAIDMLLHFHPTAPVGPVSTPQSPPPPP